MNLYEATVPVFTKMLANLEAILEKAEQHARDRKYDSAVLVQARLAPNQWALGRQIGAACDQVKWTVSKMTGKEAPSHPDYETRIDELRARIRSVREYIAGFTKADFEKCADRPCGHAWMGGKTMRAADYLDHFALPNFYFHYAHAYAILRHNGIDLAKADYLGSLPFTA